MSDDQRQRSVEVEVADAILELVRSTSVGGSRGDSAAMVVLGTHVQAIRRLSRIRDLACDGAGAEAFILARSLLSMVARAIWVDRPADPAERRSRFDRWLKHDLEEDIREQKSLGNLGVDVAADLQELREQLAALEDVDGFPTERQLLAQERLGLAVYYSRVYIPASGHVHYSLRSAIGEARAAADDGEELDPERRDYELADDALRRAILTFGFFLEQSEKTLRHGLSSAVLNIVFGSDAFVAERSRRPGNEP